MMTYTGLSYLYSCKHLCCREGLDKVPKPPKELLKNMDCRSKMGPTASPQNRSEASSKLPTKAHGPSNIETIDLSTSRDKIKSIHHRSRSHKELDKLHKGIATGPLVPTVANKTPQYSYTKGEEPDISFLSKSSLAKDSASQASSDYGDSWMNDLPSPSAFLEDSGIQYEPIRTSHKSIDDNSTELPLESTTQGSHGTFSTVWQKQRPEMDVENTLTQAEPDCHNLTYPTQTQFPSPAEDSLRDIGSLPRDDIKKSQEPTPKATAGLTSPSTVLNLHKITEESGDKPSRTIHFEPSPRPCKIVRTEQEPPVTVRSPMNKEAQEASDSKARPFRNMEGIDLDLLAQFQDIIEFVE